MDYELDEVDTVIMNDFSDELFPDFFGELEPIDFSTTSLMPRHPGHPDDHTYVAGSPHSDDSGLSSDTSPSTPPLTTHSFFRDSIGGALDYSSFIKQEPPSPECFETENFLNDFNEQWKGAGVKEEVNLDELPALSALNNPSSILEDEVAADFLTHELSPPVKKLSLGTINMSQIQQLPKRNDLQDSVEILTTTPHKANRVNVVRLNKPTSLPFSAHGLMNGNILTTSRPGIIRPASSGWSTTQSSSKYPKLALTSEEKVLLEKEGIALPNDGPLTKEEDRLLKAVRRKIRNKISAKESRKKKQVYVDGLEDRVKACTVHNIQLQKKVKKLEEQNDTLMQQLKKLQSYVANGASRTSQVSTCAMVLLFSFALVVLPSLNKFVKMDESSLAKFAQEQSGQKAPIMPGRSRSLLQDMETDSYIIPYGPQDPLPKSPVPEAILTRSRAKFFDEDADLDPYGTAAVTKMEVIDTSPRLSPSDPEIFIGENDTSQLLKPAEDRSGLDFDMDLRIGTTDLKTEPFANTA